MRYISVEDLCEGMVLGKTLYGQRGELLLVKDSLIKKDYVNRIKDLGYAGLYIQDDFSKDIEIQEIIRPEIKRDAIERLRTIYLADQSKNGDELNESMREIRQLVSGIVDDVVDNKDVMINMIDLKVFDDYTFYHSVNVAILAIATGIGVGLNRATLNALGVAGILHDIGKKFIPKEILDKKGRLTEKEFEAVKDHPYFGYAYIKHNFNLSAVINVGILQHHEKFDGSGYPMGKKAKEISAFARILTVADVYDALISKRPYHDAMLPHLALEFINGETGKSFDPDVVRIFTKKIAPYPVGIEVELSNGMKGLVIKNYEGFSSRPLVRVLSNDGIPLQIDLRHDSDARELFIVKIAN